MNTMNVRLEKQILYDELLSWRTGIDWFKKLVIVASNDLNEETLYSLEQQVRGCFNAA